MQLQDSVNASLPRRLQSLPTPCPTESSAPTAQVNRRASWGERQCGQAQSKRYSRAGSRITFEDAAFQRRARDKILQLIEEMALPNGSNNTLIARKVLKYRKLPDIAAERCVLEPADYS
ncbi:hypothetical protein PRIC1_008535 [Phytophthora ramorum]